MPRIFATMARKPFPPARAQVRDEVEFAEEALDVEVHDGRRRLAVVARQGDGDESADNVGIAVDGQMQPIRVGIVGRHQPNLALATTDKVLLDAMLHRKLVELAAQVDEEPVLVLPTVEEAEALPDVPKGSRGHQ